MLLAKLGLLIVVILPEYGILIRLLYFVSLMVEFWTGYEILNLNELDSLVGINMDCEI